MTLHLPAPERRLAPAITNAVLTPLEQLGCYAGLDHQQADERVRGAAFGVGRDHRQLAYYLHDIGERRLYQMHGFASIVAYAEARCGINPGTTRDYLLVGKRLLELPGLDAALAEGSLHWSQVRALARKIRPEHEQEWIRLAKTMNCRELEYALRRSTDGRPPRGDARGLRAVRFKVQASLDTVAFEEWELAKERFSEETGETQGDEQLLKELLRLYLSTNADGTIPGRRPVKESHYKVVLRTGPDAQKPDEVVTEDGKLPLPHGRASMLLCCGAEAQGIPCKAPPTDEKMRRRIRARDGHHCLCCDSRRDVQVHHLIWREHGGLTVPENLLCLCERCHALVHEKLLTIEGEVPSGLQFLDSRGYPIDRRVLTGYVAPPTPPIVRFADVPARVDAEWWRQHRELLPWNERRGALEFREGTPTVAEEPTAHVRAEETGVRPARLTDVVGQTRAVSSLQVAVHAAAREERTVPHVLLAGPAGVGKTTIARALAHEVKGELHAIAAPLVDEVPKLVGMLVSLRPSDVLFVDEVHALPRPVAEVLYQALEDRRLSLPLVHGATRRTLEIELPAFTCVAATTDEGALPEPLRARFPLREVLVRLSDAEVAEAVRRAASRIGIALDDGAAELLASVSNGTPRQALALLGRARDEMASRGGIGVDLECARAALERAGIDERGLGPVEREIVALLGDGRPRALAQIAAHVGLPAETVARLHEPLLLRLGLVRITPRGRVGVRERCVVGSC